MATQFPDALDTLPTNNTNVTPSRDFHPQVLHNDLNAAVNELEKFLVGSLWRTAHEATGDGVADDTTAVQAAQTSAGPGRPVRFAPNKTYLLTDTITVGSSCTWEGVRGERGANSLAVPDYPSTVIKWRPADLTKFLVSKFDASSGSGEIGPFVFRNLTFDLGDANGFEFGREDVNGDGVSDVVVNGAGQKYVAGVKFEHCAFQATVANRASDANGVITRSGRKMAWLTKCFETTFNDVSFYGGDTQVRTWGCDRPIFRDIRSLGSHLPFDLNESGGFAVQHVLDKVQVEGYTFTPVKSAGVQLALTTGRFEQVDAAAGIGRFTLPATAAVAAGSGTLTFSQDMTNKLFPGLSIIELTDGTNVDSCLVTAVSGTSVTVDTTAFAFTWSAATATVVRIHGYGPFHGGLYSANLSTISMSPGAGAPPFVYLVHRGTMQITAASSDFGAAGYTPSLVLGNRFVTNQYLYSQMAFSGCAATVVADPAHPLVHVDNWGAPHGRAPYLTDKRGFGTHLAEERALLRRVWIYSPKHGVRAAGASMPLKRVLAEADTEGRIWAWLTTSSSTQLFIDRTLPSIQSRTYRMLVRIRGVTAAGTFSVFAGGAGTGAFIIPAGTAFTTEWQTVSVVFTPPNSWATVNSRVASTDTHFVVTPSVDAYLAAVEIEEVVTGALLTGTATWNPASVAAGAQVTTTVTVTGATLGDPVAVGFSQSLQAMQLTGYVSAANTVTVVLQNGTVGAIDLASGTLRATVMKHEG